MKITITDNTTNQIVKTMFCPEKWQADQVSEGQTIHKGHYPSNLYTYNGESFNLISGASIQVETDRALIIKLMRSMNAAGLKTEVHIPNFDTKLNCKNAVDQAAGRARMRLVSQGFLIELEYNEVAAQVKQWRENGSDPTLKPRAIDDEWVTEKGQTAEEAAQDVEAIKSIWDNALMDIRNLRLKGKAAIDNAPQANCMQVAQTYIDSLDAINIAT